MTDRTCDGAFYAIMDDYNSGVEPLENWATGDIVRLINVLDAELQRRADEESAAQHQSDYGQVYDRNSEDDHCA